MTINDFEKCCDLADYFLGEKHSECVYELGKGIRDYVDAYLEYKQRELEQEHEHRREKWHI